MNNLLDRGQIIENKIEVEEFLGSGSFAQVYKVKHIFLGSMALKILNESCSSMREMQEMLSEAAILSQMAHPNIIRVYDAGIIKIDNLNYGYFTMDFIAGGDLESFRKRHKVSVDDSIEITTQICNGLAEAHGQEKPIIHRDLKPANVLLGYDDQGIRIRISDFGLAKPVDPNLESSGLKGTPMFKPPESYEKGIDSPAGDIWAVGTILYLLLTNKYPFSIKGIHELYAGICWEQELIPPSHLNPSVNEKLEVIVLKSLALEREKRYKDAKDMLKDLLELTEQLKIEKPVKTVTDSQGKEKSDEEKSEIMKLVNEAIALSKKPGKLRDAADLLEEAMIKDPDIRNEYDYKLKNWRRNIIV